jgi:8-oxo-dGTP diphosphatase
MAKQSPTEKHLKFAVLATDIALFTMRDGQLFLRMTAVDRPPYFPASKGLPGGLIDPKETAEEAARRLLNDKAHVRSEKIYLEQLYTFSEIDRDPRGRVVAVAYIGFIPWESLTPTEQLDTKEAWWVHAESTTKLAYDHNHVQRVACERVRSRVRYTTLMVKLMPQEFTLTELETAYENILKADLDKRNFRKKILKLNILKVLGRKRSGGAFRPAELYSFATTDVHDIEMI